MVNASYDERITWSQSFICGGAAAILSRSLTSPLEVAKVLAQVGTEDSRGGLARTFVNVYRSEGIKAFWKGNGVSCIRLFPYSAVQYAAFASVVTFFEDPHCGHLSNTGSMLAGSGSTLVAMVTVYPLEVIKTRLIVQHTNPSLANYRGIQHAFRTMWREEGLLALYKGLTPSFLGIVPFAGGSFLAYHWLDRLYPAIGTETYGNPTHMFISACIAAAFAQTISHPFDTIRKKMQARSKTIPGGGGVDIEFKGMCSAFVQTVKVNGRRGPWRGLTANLLKIVPNAGLMFLSFEHIRRVFLYYNGYTESPWWDVPKSDVDQSLSPHELELHVVTPTDKSR